MQSSGEHHVSLRKRLLGKLEPYPHPRVFKRILDRLILVVAIGGPVALVPQVVQVLTLQDASDLSPVTWIAWQIFSVIWLLYGIVHKETPIIIANSFYVVLQAIILGAIVAYG
ncbi:MAG: SemiSWEET family transporter [Minisyncoccia bacterium]